MAPTWAGPGLLDLMGHILLGLRNSFDVEEICKKRYLEAN